MRLQLTIRGIVALGLMLPGIGSPQGPVAATPERGLSIEWPNWWKLKEARYLKLKTSVLSEGVDTYEFWGFGGLAQVKNHLAPSPTQVYNEVVPQLILEVAQPRSPQALGASLVALARIGDADDQEIGFDLLIGGYLSHEDPEVAEAAALSLGILGKGEAAPPLIHVARDSREGRVITGQREGVPERMRVCAALSLGLIAERCQDSAIQGLCAAHLMELLVDPSAYVGDLPMAAMLALGFCPIREATSDPMTEADALGLPLRAASRAACSGPEAQLHFLMQRFVPGAPQVQASLTPVIQAQASSTFVRLLDELDADGASRWKPIAWKQLCSYLKSEQGRHPWLTQAALLSLGSLGDADDDAIDQEIRSTLESWCRRSPATDENALAILALAEAGSREGRGTKRWSRVVQVRSTLLELMTHGPRELRPWTALALGTFGDHLKEQGHPLLDQASRELIAALQAEPSPQEAGALAIAAGLRRNREAVRPFALRLQTVIENGNLGEAFELPFLSLSSGLLMDGRLVDPLQTLALKSLKNGPLLHSICKGLALLGDKELLDELFLLLDKSDSPSLRRNLLQAIAHVGDSRSITPLLEMLEDETASPWERVLALEALGCICDPAPLPWNTGFLESLNPTGIPTSLTSPSGTGLLDRP